MIQKVLLLGSTGLTGGLLLEKLKKHPKIGEIMVIVRSPTGESNDKVTTIVSDFTNLEALIKKVPEVDIVYSCLGTTRNKTPDLEEYRKIEVEIPYRIGEFALKNGAKQFHYISSIGVSPKSKNFYLKMKNEAESKLSSLAYSNLNIYRPSLIIGDRNEFRFSETISSIFFLLFGFLIPKRYKSINAETVAEAILEVSLQNLEGKHVFESAQIQDLGKEKMD